MRGQLSETSAADACRGLADQAATGTLAVDGLDGVGTVAFVDGQVVGATSPAPRSRLGDRLVGAGYLTDDALAEALELQRESGDTARLGALLVERGLVARDAVRLFVQDQLLDALFDVFRWRFGSFEFVPGDGSSIDVEEVPLRVPVDEALVEVARRHQEWEELSQVIPSLEAIPSFCPGASSAAAALEPDEFAVLASLDGERSVRALAVDLGYGEFEAARIVYGLCLLGVVEVRSPEDSIGSALDDALAYIGDRPDASDQDEPPGEGEQEPEPGEEQPTRDRADEPAGDDDEEPDLDELFAELALNEPSAEGATDQHDRVEPPAGAPSTAADEVGGTQSAEPDLFVRRLDDAPAMPPPATDVPAEPPLPSLAVPAAGADRRPPADAPARTPPPAEASPPATPRPPPEGARDLDKKADVSEFLRELSRLALSHDDAGAGKGGEPGRGGERPVSPRGTEPPRRADPDDRGRRKRGLFGRGG